MKVCDNTSVGVIITNESGEYLMFDRNTFPPGTAPAAGHIDDHGSAEDAARAEVHEELGLHVVSLEWVAGGDCAGRVASAITGRSTRPR
jgi:8-oxo-dGTP pyrophosphatase MutT (NUDIX family)